MARQSSLADPPESSSCDGKWPAVSRANLVRTVFCACDVDKDGCLNNREMRVFAEQSGFKGGDADWAEAYSTLCAENGVVESVGISLEVLARLVDDPAEETGCYCTDEDLRLMITSLFPCGTLAVAGAPATDPVAVATTAASAPLGPTSTAVVSLPLPRSELILAVFRACDVNDDGLVRCSEMRRFAEQTGFRGDDADWDDAYTLLCRARGVDVTEGISFEVFADLVNDKSGDTGCFCSDRDLRVILAELTRMAKAKTLIKSRRPTRGRFVDVDSTLQAEVALDPSKLPRSKLIHELFCAFDADGDGRLSQLELRRFVDHIGSRCTDGDWPQAYASFTTQHSTNRGAAVDEALFTRLVDGEFRSIMSRCHDAKLGAILSALSAVSREIQARVDVESAQPSLDHENFTPARVGKEPAQPRSELIHSVFCACDTDGDGVLSLQEMRSFAILSSFDGGEDEWRELFEGLLCTEGSSSCSSGIRESLFTRLVSDSSGTSEMYCTDEELSAMLPYLEDRTRDTLARLVFRRLVGDLEGLLMPDDFLRFAFRAGFRADDPDWAIDFAMLCREHGDDPGIGICWPTFSRLLACASNRGCIDMNRKLREIMNSLLAEATPQPDASSRSMFAQEASVEDNARESSNTSANAELDTMAPTVEQLVPLLCTDKKQALAASKGAGRRARRARRAPEAAAVIS